MITSYEVGAVFKIINQASPALRTILGQVRVLNQAIERARANLAEIGKSSAATGTAVAETRALAKEWGDVAKNAKAAQLAIGQAAGASARASGAGAAAAAAGAGGGGRVPGGGRQRLGQRLGHGGGGLHGYFGGHVPGGHIGYRPGSGGTAALIGAAGVGYGAYQAAEMEDAVFQLIYHSGVENNDANRGKFRKILQDAMVSSGYGLHDIAESAKQEIRMFQGTQGGGIDVLPEMLRAATIESRLKGESPEESMKALIGLAHMTKQYDPEAIKKLAPAFAFISTANPGSLGSIEKAAGYAVPILQSSMGVDPMQALLLGTALTRAGATSTKSGTWLREMAMRAMPGTALFESAKKSEHHDELLKRLGLLDDKEKPTWFTDGKPDIMKMLSIAGENIEKVPMSERAGVERKLFGAQGAGGLSLLTDPAVREQIAALTKEMNSPEFKNRYGAFQSQYNSEVTAQTARTALQDFNVTMMDLGAHVLPAVNAGLKDLKGVLEAVRSVLPNQGAGASGWSNAKIGARAAEGALIGGGLGAFMGGVGAGPGAGIGAITGGLFGIAEQYMNQHGSTEKYERPADRYQRRVDQLNSGHKPPAPVVHLNVNLDGKAIAQAVSERQAQDSQYETNSPANDPSQFYGP